MNWTISRRITLAFAIGALLVFSIGGISIWQLNQTIEAYGEALDVERSNLLRAATVRADLSNANVAYLRALITSDMGYRTARDSAVAGSRQAMRELEARATGADARLWTDALRLLNTWDAASARVLALHAQGAEQQAVLMNQQEVQPIRQQLEQLQDAAMDAAVVVADRHHAAAQQTSRAAKNAILVGLVLAAILFVIAGYLLNRAIAGPLSETSSVLASSAAQILAATSQQASGATESLAAVTQTAATVDEVVQTAEQSAERARTVASSAQRAAEIGRQGREAVEVSVTAMDGVQQKVGEIGASIVSLSDQAQAIGEIIATVNDLAEQTNLLALNAAIEAARAGEQGKGFAVVAGEVKNLAEQSKAGTVRIRQILEQVQRATTAAVVVTEQGNTAVADVTRQVKEAGETIRKLSDEVASAAQAAAQIAASAGQQSTGMSQIGQAISSIQQAAQQNLAATRQAEASAQELNRLGASLVYLVAGGAAPQQPFIRR